MCAFFLFGAWRHMVGCCHGLLYDQEKQNLSIASRAIFFAEFFSNSKIKIIGIRQGEKLHEEMITKEDLSQVVDYGKYYAILPFRDKFKLKKYTSRKKVKILKENFSYNSRDNNKFLTSTNLRNILKKEKFL